MQGQVVSFAQAKLLQRESQPVGRAIHLTVSQNPVHENEIGEIGILPGGLGQGGRHRRIRIVQMLGNVTFIMI